MRICALPALVLAAVVTAAALHATRARADGGHPRRRHRPAALSPPSISGPLAEGAVLDARPGRWRSTTPVRYAYQWQRCYGACAVIPGADRPTYRLAAADVGQYVQVRVTATNRAGSANARSSWTDAIGPSSQTLERDTYEQLLPRAASTTVAIELVTRGYELPFTPATPGQLQVAWFLGRPAASDTPARHAARETVVAAGETNFGRTDDSHVLLQLTASGRALIQRDQSLAVTAVATFTPSHSPAVVTRRMFLLG